VTDPSPDSRGDKLQTASTIAKAILDVVSSVPRTGESLSASPRERGRVIANQAALKAAAVSGTLALPPGPLGVLTLVPDLVVVWRLQAQMVADIGGAYGKTASLSQEQMLYCLFRHAAAQVVRDLGVRVGERFIFRPATLRVLQTIARRLGMQVTQRFIAQSVARWLPVVGSLGVAAYAYFDTGQVAATAMELFEQVSNDEDGSSNSGDGSSSQGTPGAGAA
jgi:uncharacterized protein (DUF697 family)